VRDGHTNVDLPAADNTAPQRGHRRGRQLARGKEGGTTSRCGAVTNSPYGPGLRGWGAIYLRPPILQRTLGKGSASRLGAGVFPRGAATPNLLLIPGPLALHSRAGRPPALEALATDAGPDEILEAL
jgi:hypothetical protein